MISKKDKIYITGHKGLVGSATYRKLKDDGFKRLIVEERKNLDLSDQGKVYKFLKKNKPKLKFKSIVKIMVDADLKNYSLYNYVQPKVLYKH